MTESVEYKPDGKTLEAYLKCRDYFMGIRGPVGGGKTVASCMKVLQLACEQKPNKNNKRRTRWVFVRNTNPELRTTTIKTWLEWVPEEIFGPMRWSPPYTHHIKFQLPDETEVDCEVIFLALDKPGDAKKLLSLELTGAFINEAREIPKSIIDILSSRVSRFPPKKEGGPTWNGILADTNSMPADHWWPIMAGDRDPPESMSAEDRMSLVKPEGYTFFSQPGAYLEEVDENGMFVGYVPNELAENTKYLDKAYYENNIKGKTRSYIRVYVLNEYESLEDNEPVYPEFHERTHVCPEPIEYDPDYPLWVGLDFGLKPAAVFMQKVRGQWRILGELCHTNMGMTRFATLLHERLVTQFPGATYRIYGDPTGVNRSDVDERTPYDILLAKGIPALPCHTNDQVIRREAVRVSLIRQIEGKPGLQINSAQCPITTRGFQGGYGFKRVLGSAALMGSTKEVNKDNPYSHPHDCVQYVMVAAGEGDMLLGQANQKLKRAKTGFNVFNRRGVVRARA